MPSLDRDEIVFWNCNNLSSNKYSQLEMFLTRRRPLIMGFCETKHQNENNAQRLVGYSCISKPFVSGESGLCCYTSSQRVTAHRRLDLENNPHVLWVQCNIPGIITNLLVGVFYFQAKLGVSGFDALVA